MTGGFQTGVSQVPAVGVAGDFASANPYYTYDAGPGGLVAGPNGVTVGRFAWAVAPADADGAGSSVSNQGTGIPAGLVGRQGQPAVITAFLADASMVIPSGYQMELMIGGDFWVVNDGASQATPGMKAYANFADGKVTFAATGNAASGGTSSASTIAQESAVVNASIAGDIMTVNSVGSGTLYPGAVFSSGGSGVAAGTTIVQQLSGTEGGVGTYAVSIPEQSVASANLTFHYGLVTIGGSITGTFPLGSTLAGSGVSGSITADASNGAGLTGTGGAGTYVTGAYLNISSQEIDANPINVETKFYCRTSGLAGELVKISSQPLG